MCELLRCYVHAFPPKFPTDYFQCCGVRSATFFSVCTAIFSFRFFESLGIYIFPCILTTSSSFLGAIAGFLFPACFCLMSVFDVTFKLIEDGMISSYIAAVVPTRAPVTMYPFEHFLNKSANTFSAPLLWLTEWSNLERCMPHQCTLDIACLGDLGIISSEANTYKRFLWSLNTCVRFARQNE